MVPALMPVLGSLQEVREDRHGGGSGVSAHRYPEEVERQSLGVMTAGSRTEPACPGLQAEGQGTEHPNAFPSVWGQQNCVIKLNLRALGRNRTLFNRSCGSGVWLGAPWEPLTPGPGPSAPKDTGQDFSPPDRSSLLGKELPIRVGAMGTQLMIQTRSQLTAKVCKPNQSVASLLLLSWFHFRLIPSRQA